MECPPLADKEYRNEVVREKGCAACLSCAVDGSGNGLQCGCKPDQVIFTTGFGQDEVFRIGTAGCSRAEILVYLVNAQNRYESVYGSQVWKIARDGVTLEENVKDMVLARVSQIKAMCLLAESKGLSLEEEEKAESVRRRRSIFIL